MRSPYLKILVVFVLINLSVIPVTYAQEKKVNQKQIDKQRRKKQKQAEKEYHDAIKQHMKNQSRNTKAMMKQSRKESGTMTPVKP